MNIRPGLGLKIGDGVYLKLGEDGKIQTIKATDMIGFCSEVASDIFVN